MTMTEQAAGFGLGQLSVVLLTGSLVLVVAVAAVRLASHSGLPTLLLYLAIGLALLVAVGVAARSVSAPNCPATWPPR